MDPALASISATISNEANTISQRRREHRNARVKSHESDINRGCNLIKGQRQSGCSTSFMSCYSSISNKVNVGRSSQCVPSKFSTTLLSAVFIASLFTPLISADKDTRRKLSVCERYQACAAEISHFPLLSETVGEMRAEIEDTNNNNDDGSGELDEGSGVSGVPLTEIPADDFPLYDEFVTAQPVFDYNTDAEHDKANICRCPDRDEVFGEESNGCELGATDGDNVLRVDKSIRLAFCRPISKLFHMKCLGQRAVLRIIGDVDLKTGEALVNVNDTAVFCRCEAPLEFRRVAVEPWQDKYAFVYRCSAP